MLADMKGKLVNSIAENLYEKVTESGVHSPVFNNSGKDFDALPHSLKSFLLDYTARIESKYRAINFIIRPFKDFCRTPLITDEEIEKLAKTDHGILLTHKLNPDKTYDWKPFFTKLNYLIPVELKKAGYEIIRYEEISEISNSTINKLARAIHSAYLREIRNKGKSKIDILNFPLETGIGYSSEFDKLPHEIKMSNIDNAANIPAKLLSIGYKIRQVKKGFKPFALHLKKEEIETMARVEHIRWSWEKRLNGWTFGNVKNDTSRTHPGLISYEELSESEKDKDRELVKLIPALLQDIDYEAYPVSPNRIRNLTYAIKPQSSINRILNETRDLNDQIRSLATLTPEMEAMIELRNKKIEDAIHEIEGSYKYAQHIQETFLPDDFLVRETFPDSFILFKPKDIVSGDFYFFSKREELIIFAVADCTGHGIPGALLSTIGYNILDQAVNEIKIVEPSLIIQHLYNKIHRFLRNDSEGTGIQDDMDIILCTLDTRTNLLAYSGVKNPLYCLRDGKLLEFPAQNSQSATSEIQLKTSDTLYLCSDGYSDQIGGKSHKRYQTGKLKNFLTEIHECSMPEQSDRLYEEIENWRELNNEDQTDDILILGIRI